ncbi:unnamed protein product [Larinioides sclopetarius]|uniref:Uncharacterized protein n=1 Tax=Larinioides sclopetarius TaxID=280406 RepID=A0AAV1YXR9_9ARAC
MWNFSLQMFHELRTFIFYTILSAVLINVQATEVTDSTWNLDNSMGFPVNIPVLTCRTKYTEYNEIRWYKDYILLQKGSKAHFPNHMLVLKELLTNSPAVHFDHPLQLQGYYWCETDYINASVVHKYLFRIAEVKTYVGKFISTEDDLGDDEALNIKEKIALKKKIYEDDMQNMLFGFLPTPNNFVIDISPKKKGLEVKFYLYARRAFDPRRPYDEELVEDQSEWQFILQYLNNETDAIDEEYYKEILEWTSFKGIDLKNIILYSTLGCYEDKTLVLGEPPKELSWRFARLGEVVIPNEACSSKDGLAVTRICGGNFYTGARWGSVYGRCEVLLSKLTSALQELYYKFGNDPKPEYIHRLQRLTHNVTQLTVPDVHIILDILTELSKVPELTSEEIDETFTVINRLNSLNESEIVSAKATIRFTSRLLKIIDNVLRFATEKSKEVFVTKQDFLVETKSTKVNTDVEDHIIGIAVLPSKHANTLENASVEFLSTSSNIPKDISLAYFLLPPELVITREKETAPKYPCQINIVLFKDWSLFPRPTKVLYKRNYRIIPTPVMYVSLSGGPAWNMSSPVQLYFKNTHDKKIENPVCVNFDPQADNEDGDWGTEGCEYGGLKDGFHICRCRHLSIFAVILSEKYDTSAFNFRLGTSVYVGCALSIIGLLLTILLYLLSKVWRSTIDHSILFWLAVSLLCCLIVIFVSEMKFKWKPGCLVMGLLLHYFIIVTFGWLLVQSVMNRLRFANKTDMDEVPHFLLKSFISVWSVPILIIIIIWLTKDYHYHDHISCWKTVSEVSYAAAIPIAVIIFVSLCMNMCAIYAVSCRFKKDFLIGNSIYKESVVKFRVAVTIYLFFILTWLFGFFALNNKSKELKILFAISIFHEVSFWEMCQKWRKDRKRDKENPAVKYVPGGQSQDQQSSGIPAE